MLLYFLPESSGEAFLLRFRLLIVAHERERGY